MNLSQLRHFVALAEFGSFTEAAKQADLTQPALSRSITQLEEEFGGVLVDRLGHRNEITAFGRVALEHARRVLFEADELWSRVRSETNHEGERLLLGFGSTPGELLTEPLLRHMASKRPAPQLTLMRGARAHQIEALRARRLDAAVLELSEVLSVADDLHIDPLPRLSRAVLCRRDHPLALRKQLQFTELLDWPLVTTQVSEGQARFLVGRYGPQAHPSRWMSFSCEDLGPMLRTVAATDAIYLGVLAPARPLIKQGALVVLPVQPDLGYSSFGIVRLAVRSVPPALERVRMLIFDLMREAAAISVAEFDTAQ